MEVNATSTSDNVRTYAFDRPVELSQFSWLDGHRNIDSYTVSGKTLTITKTDSMDWISLESNFIVPGLKRTFGESLKVNSEVYASNR